MKMITIYLFIVLNLNAHTLVMNILDNEDGTISVEGVFNTGEVAVGAMIRLESLVNGSILLKERITEEGEITIIIPNEEYQIVLDGGPGHVIVDTGISPRKGFKKKASSYNIKELSKQTQGGLINVYSTVLFSLSFILIALVLFFSSKNTKILIKEIKSIKNFK